MSVGVLATPTPAQILAETEALIEGLRAAAHAAGLRPGDPLAPVVESLYHVVRHLEVQRLALAEAMDGAVETIGDLLMQGRETAEAETARFEGACTAIEAEVVERVAAAIGKAADAALVQRVRGGGRRAGYRAALALVLTLGVGAGAGWPVAERTAEARIARVAGDVRLVFRDGPETAQAWRDLMVWNDLKAALAIRAAPGEVLMQGGRRACRIPLWVARPPAAQ